MLKKVSMAAGAVLVLLFLLIGASADTANPITLRDINPIQIKISGTKYIAKQAVIEQDTLLIQCKTSTYEPAPKELLSSQYGALVRIVYEDGKKDLEKLYCIPSGEDELSVTAEDAKAFENVSQIYIAGKELFEQ